MTDNKDKENKNTDEIIEENIEKNMEENVDRIVEEDTDRTVKAETREYVSEPRTHTARRPYRRNAHLKKIKQQRKIKRMLIISSALLCVLSVTGGLFYKNVSEQKASEQEAKEREYEQKKKKLNETKIEVKSDAQKKAEKIERIKQEAVAAGCPEELLSLIDKNEETLGLLENYSAKKDVPPAENIGDDGAAGGIPSLLQWDERWGYASYGTSTIAASGCGPTCMSMVITGLSGDITATPYKMAKYSEEHAYLDETNNTYWIFMNEAASDWGITCREAPPDEMTAQQELAAGHPIICSVGPGDFTQTGHFIVLTGYADGKVTVNDPFSRANSEKTWVYAEIASQIREMWIYSPPA